MCASDLKLSRYVPKEIIPDGRIDSRKWTGRGTPVEPPEDVFYFQDLLTCVKANVEKAQDEAFLNMVKYGQGQFKTYFDPLKGEVKVETLDPEEMTNTCEDCDGTGKAFPDCESCYGDGFVVMHGGTETCLECDNEPCATCDGHGYLE